MLGVKSHARGAFDSGFLHGARTAYSTLTQVRQGWLVYPKLMAWEGALSIVPAALDGRWVTPEFVAYEAAQGAISPSYLSQLISWAGFVDAVRSSSTGTNVRRRRLQPRDFETIEIPVPPIEEQHRIARHLMRLAQLSIRPESHGRLGRRATTFATADAPRAALGTLLELSREPVTIIQGDSYKRIGIYSWGKGILRRDPVAAPEMGSMRYFRFPIPSLIFSNIQAWEGAVALSGEAHRGYVCSSRFYPYVPRPGTDVSLPYLFEYFRTKEGVEQLRRASPGTQVRNKVLSRSMLEATEIPVPARRIQDHVETQAQVVERIQTTTSQAQRLSSAILPAARNEIFDSMR